MGTVNVKTFCLKTENISLCLRRKGRGCGSGQVLFNRKKYPKPAGKYPGLSYLRCQPSGVHPCSLVSFPGVSRSFTSGCRILHLFSCVCCARWHGCSKSLKEWLCHSFSESGGWNTHLRMRERYRKEVRRSRVLVSGFAAPRKAKLLRYRKTRTCRVFR